VDHQSTRLQQFTTKILIYTNFLRYYLTLLVLIQFNMEIVFQVVEKLGGFNKVNAQNQWKLVTQKLNLMNATATTSTANLVKNLYKK
jgi:hypothetical protein